MDKEEEREKERTGIEDYFYKEFLTGLYELFRDYDVEIEAEEDQLWMQMESPYKQWHLNRFLCAGDILDLIKELDDSDNK